MIDQRAEFRRQGLHGRFRGRQLADLGQPDRGPDQPQGPLGRTRSTSPTRRPARTTSSPPSPPCCWCARAAGICRRSICVVDGQPMSGALFDFGLYVFHQCQDAARARHRPLFLPAEDGEPSRGAPVERGLHPCRRSALGIPVGTIKATVLIETLPAAFEMDEIIYELRDHMAGLNCGRWDYIFSFIKTLAQQAGIPAARPRPGGHGQGLPQGLFGAAHQDLPPPRRLRHGRHGGADSRPHATRRSTRVAFDKVRADKEREAKAGHDGTWVAHPDLVPVAQEVFDRLMPEPNQLDSMREDVTRRPEGAARGPRGHAHRGGPPREHPRRRAVYRGVAARPRRGAALQSDGGRRHRRDQPLADLAAAPFRRGAGGRPEGDDGALRQVPHARRWSG